MVGADDSTGLLPAAFISFFHNKYETYHLNIIDSKWCRHSSVEFSVHSILPPWVRFPSTSFYNVEFETVFDIGE